MNIFLGAFFLFIGIRFVVIAINFFSRSGILKTDDSYDDLISVLIPARNEENNIARLLESVYLQNYLNFETIVLDDASTDRTFLISADFCTKMEKLRVIKGKTLPAGWLGKNFACHQLAMEAKGKYLLFLDADVVIKNDLFNSAVKQMKAHDLQLLSLFAEQQTVSLGEKIVVPLMHYLLLSLLPIKLIYSAKDPAFSVASGQFMLFDAETYRKYQWHQRAKAKIAEDLAIMKKIKTAGLKGEALMANGLIGCRMYRSYADALNGFSKNFLAVFNNNFLLFAGYLFLLLCGPFFLFATHNFWLTGFTLGLIIAGRIMIASLAGQNIFYEVLLHPLQIFNLIVIFFKIVYNRLNGNAQWKGRPIHV